MGRWLDEEVKLGASLAARPAVRKYHYWGVACDAPIMKVHLRLFLGSIVLVLASFEKNLLC